MSDEKVITEQQVHENPYLSLPTESGDSELKTMLVKYVGTKFDKEQVTAEMIIETLAMEFPELMFVFAEENFIRGYELGINDAHNGFTEISAEQITTND